MKISDILRVIANNLDHPEGGAPDPRIQNPAGLIQVAVDGGEDISTEAGKTASGNDANPDIFLPPLQQKQELLKKAVGVENVYDDGTPDERMEQAKEEEAEQTMEQSNRGRDPVDEIRKLGGIPAAVVQELSNDDVTDD